MVLWLVLAGCSSSGLATGAGTWEVLAPMPTPRTEVAVAELNGLIYSIGGFNATGTPVATVEAYNPLTNSWSAAAPLPQAVHHAGAATASGRLFVIGGLTGPGFIPTDAVWEFDPASGPLGSWHARAPLPEARGAMGVAVLDGRIHAVGGQRLLGNRRAAVTDHAAYDPLTNTWQTLASLEQRRDHLAAGAIGERLYAIGGRNLSLSSNTGTLEEYDPATDTWRRLPAMPTARGGIAAAALNGLLLVLGGEATFGTFSANEAYDPLINQWQALAPLPTARHGLGAAALGGAVYALGGGPEPGLTVSGANERFGFRP